MRWAPSPSRRALAVPFALLAAVTLAAGCAPSGRGTHAPAESMTAPVDGGTLTYGRGHDSVRLDPGHETDG